MGSVASKRVEKTLAASPDFTAAVSAAFRRSLDLSEHAFPGVRRYQLYFAAEEIHRDLISGAGHHLVDRWLPSPPTRVQVDRAAAAAAGGRRRGNPRRRGVYGVRGGGVRGGHFGKCESGGVEESAGWTRWDRRNRCGDSVGWGPGWIGYGGLCCGGCYWGLS
ncbi:hypothetical protein Syun_005919 [Stephania yunnanensis]|uniref:Uncharacterized protein n=1 Tax=Stephania yunnanensis TaxID=152371 RepID=A0AAP0PX27_9MAGN